jgi:hypothetical protein
MDDEHNHLASLRPSRLREVQGGAPAWAEVELIDIQSGQGDAVRAGLESFGLRVRRTAVGQSRHLVAVLGEQRDADFVVLLCHGDEGAILFPELAEEVERYQGFHGRITPEELRRFARFTDQVVIATGCETGHAALADAVLDCGAAAYLAPIGAPFGYASVFAPLFVFYELTERRTLEQAARRLNAHDSELSMWRLYRR